MDRVMNFPVASWDGINLYATHHTADADNTETAEYQDIQAWSFDENTIVPWMPDDNGVPFCLLWPIERLLLRPFTLPLPNPRLVDEAVLEQELEEQAGESASDWWLSWQTVISGNTAGVHGIWFALPAVVQNALADDNHWQKVRHILPDAWVRLQVQLSTHISMQSSTAEDENSDCLVFDADASGMFVGVYIDGTWAGMRRLNAIHKRLALITEDLHRSLPAMGYHAGLPIYGRVDALLAESLQSLPATSDLWQADIVEELPERGVANITASQQYIQKKRSNSWLDVPDFRRGRWRADSQWQKWLRPWIFSAILLLILAMTGLIQINVQTREYKQQITDARESINTAFHTALPDVTAMIDALAQLRAAAGEQQQGNAWHLLRHTQDITTLAKAFPAMQINSITMRNEMISLRAVVADFATANQVKQRMQSILNAENNVELADTEQDANKKIRILLRWQE
ncbi:MAG: hypothetical protein R8L53_09695 [Mariprofundales bacterium]